MVMVIVGSLNNMNNKTETKDYEKGRNCFLYQF